MKKYLFIFIAFVLFSFGLQASPAHAAVAFVASSTSGENSSAAATTTSITVSGTDPVLVIGTSLGVDSGPAATTTGVTFSLGGTAVKVASTTDGEDGYADVWCIANPPAGTGTIHATFSASLENYIVATVFSGADPSNPCPSANAVSTSTHTSNTSATLTATGLTSGDASFGMVGLFTNGDVASPYMKNNLIYENVGSGSDAESGYSTSTASVKASWQSGSNSYKDFVDVRIKQATTPAISNVSSSPSASTAVITWTTSVTGDSLVNYGTSTTYTNSSTYSGSYVTSHVVSLAGLMPSTTYHYQVVSSNGLVATSSDQTFTTGATLVAGSGNMLVEDGNNNRIEEFSATGTYEGQIGCSSGACTAGSGNGELSLSASVGISSGNEVFVDTSGNIWVSDQDNNRVEEFSATGTYESQFGSYGTGNGQFSGIDGLAVTPSGNIWVVDDTDRVEEFSATGTYIGQTSCSSGACSSGSGNGQLTSPGGIAIDSSGNLWVADYENNRVEEFSATGTYENKFGSYGTGNGNFDGPNSIAIDSSGNIWVVDESNNRVEKFVASGTTYVYNAQFGSYGSGSGEFEGPAGIAIDPSGNIWVTDSGNNRVEEFSAAGSYEGQVGCSGSSACSAGSSNGGLNNPISVESTGGGTGTLVAGAGNMLVGDYGGNRVEEFSATGTYEGQIGCSSGACGTGSANGNFNFTGTPYEPTSMAIDQNSNIWVVDPVNNRVEEFSATGTYEGQIGCSTGGCSAGSGNGEFNQPEAVAIDPSGNVWVSDTVNNRVEEFSATGTYESQFATPDNGSLDLVFDSGGNLWLLDQGHELIEKVSATGTVEFSFGTAGTGNGDFEFASAFAFDASGNIWVTDYGNNRVDEFSATGTYIRQVGCSSGPCSAGSGNGQFTAPAGITVDPSGNIWVADTEGNRVQELSATGTYESQFGSYGTGNGQFNYSGNIIFTNPPHSTLTAASGNIWVTDYGNDRVEEFSATGTYEGQIGCASGACIGGSSNGEFNGPASVAIDASGNLWVVDNQNERVEEFSATGTYEGQFGSHGIGNGELEGPYGVAIDSGGNLWVTDTNNDRVEEFSATGTYESQFGSSGSGNGEFNGPEGITIDSSGNLWVTDIDNDRVEEFSATGTYEGQIGCASGACIGGSSNGELSYPYAIAIDSGGDVWVTDANNDRVEEFSATGTYESQFGSGGIGNGELNGPEGITIDSSGNFWVTDAYNDRVEEFSATGTYESQFGSSGSGNGEFNGPLGIAITGGAGSELVPASGDILVSDQIGDRVEEFSPTGTYIGQLGGCSSGACSAGSGNGDFSYPEGMGFDTNGDLWVADTYGDRVEEFSATDTYEGQVGDCSSGSCGGGSGNGYLHGPNSVVVDSSGNIWVEDYGNERLEEFSATGTYERQTAPGAIGYPAPSGLAIDSSGNIWVADENGDAIEEFSATGTLEQTINCDTGGCPSGAEAPSGIAIDASGHIWISMEDSNNVEEFSATGTYEGYQIGCSSGACATGTGNGEFDAPGPIAIDANGNIWVIDVGNNRVEEFSATGTYEGQFGSYGTGNGEFDLPQGIVISGGGTTNISASSLQHWAWNDAIGWMDFYDTHNIIVSSAKITGYASSSAGDISLDCGTSPSGNICSTRSDYGVSNDGDGNLAGWAWNDAYGWISFCGNSSGGVSTLSGSTWHCPTSPTYQVTINPTTGVFTGWAWNDTIGWISFNCSNTSGCGTSQYDVVTTWTSSGSGTSTTGTLDSQTYDTGVSSGAQLNSVTWQGSAPSSTSVGFQFAVSASPTGPWNFTGPDGTSATSYTGVPGVPVPLTDYPVLNGRYFRYQIILNTNSNGTATPRVTGVVVNWSP